MKIHTAWVTHLSHLSGKNFLRVHCYDCKRTADLLPSDVMAKYGDMELEVLRTRLKCSCGSKHVTMFADDGR